MDSEEMTSFSGPNKYQPGFYFWLMVIGVITIIVGAIMWIGSKLVRWWLWVLIVVGILLILAGWFGKTYLGKHDKVLTV